MAPPVPGVSRDAAIDAPPVPGWAKVRPPPKRPKAPAVVNVTGASGRVMPGPGVGP